MPVRREARATSKVGCVMLNRVSPQMAIAGVTGPVDLLFTGFSVRADVPANIDIGAACNSFLVVHPSLGRGIEPR